jgi:CubicO group peptidase (beta-lactamase class C family)
VFPAPSELHSSAAFQNTLKLLESKIDEAFTSGNTTHGPVNPDDTYSIQIFSTTSEKPLLDYHRRGPAVLGNRTIDGNSVYRIASTSKLVTVYLLLLEAGDAIFSDKVTKYLPELKGVAYWDDITIGSLAGYLGDITAECKQFSPFSNVAVLTHVVFDVASLPGGDISSLFPGAFPPLADNETSGCSYGSGGCTRDVFLKNLVDRRPAYLPNTTPAYSNAAFATLGLVLEEVANSSFDEALQNLLVAPLGLNGTTSSAPNSTNAVIPGDAAASGWDIDISDAPGAAMGGLFSTPNDLSAIGRAILSSSLLPSSTTRAWLKPTSFTSSLLGAVGRPWEIYRAVINAQSNRVIDLYTKAGNLPGYGANLILIPDFDVGIVVMMAGERGTVGTTIASEIIDELLPALDEAARVQADGAFAGTYTASNGLNSTIKLSTAPGIPGLSIEEWISNGTDLRRSLWLQGTEWFQMYPTNIVSEDGKQVSWRSTYISVPDTGSPFDACPSWVVIDRPNYGVFGVDEYVFHLGEDGKAWGLEPKALKIVLEKA